MATIKKKGNPLIIGLILLGGSIAALWQNEYRFDYYKAANEVPFVEQISSLEANSLFSYSGDMDRGLIIDGEFIQRFTGYLQVGRRAEIYAWDREEDDEGRVSWSKKWMSSLEHNGRNTGFTKELTSKTFKPAIYHVGGLEIEPSEIQFVDATEIILPGSLELTLKGENNNLRIRENYFYYFKGRLGGDRQIGDERLSFSAIPVPTIATYFGKWNGHSAVKNQAEIKKGIIAGIIQDKGILHHLVAGERETALKTIKHHIERLKNIVRIAGLIAATIAGGFFFKGITKFLLFIPVFGNAISTVAGWVGMLLGFLIGVLTIALGFFSSHPMVMLVFVLIIGFGFHLLKRNAQKKQLRLKKQLKEELGYSPSDQELKELEYIKLWQLLGNDGEISHREQKRLDQWVKRNRFSSQKVESLIQRAREELSQQANGIDSLKGLIKLSLSDGTIDNKELKTLRQAASFIGLDRRALSKLINQAHAS